MKKLSLAILLAFLSLSTFAQSPDAEVGAAINSNDIFLLDEVYEKNQFMVQELIIARLSEILLAGSFNKPKEAIERIDVLKSENPEMASGLVGWQIMMLFRMGEYDEAAKRTRELSALQMPNSDASSQEGLKSLEKFICSMEGQKKSELIRPETDCEIPIFIKEIDSKNLRKGHLLYVPVTIHGKEKEFIFDTGCPGGAFMTEEYAREFNVEITMDSLQVSGTGGSGWGKMGILDSISIGNMIFKNLVVTVVPQSIENDTILPISIDLVLGSDIMKHAGEVQIYPQERKIIFPKQKTPLPSTGRNMYMNGGDHFFIKCYTADERLTMHFDSGDSAAGLYSNYFNRHKDEIERSGIKGTTKTGGFGGLVETEYYKYPSLPFRVGSKDFEMKDINIYPDNKTKVTQGNEDGSLGMAFIRLFDKVTINFDDMFVAVE